MALLAASLLLAAVPGEVAGGDDGVLSLTLEDAVNIALTGNRSLIMSRRGLKDSRLSVVSAKSDFDVKIYPAATAQATGGEAFTSETLGLGVSLEKKFATGSRLSVTSAVASLDGDEGSSVDISFEQPLFRGAGLATNLNEVKAAEYSLRSSERRDYQAIARALAAGPLVILADEPTGNLDTRTGKRILSIFEKLNEQGATILVVTHNESVAAHSRRMMRIVDGELFQ